MIIHLPTGKQFANRKEAKIYFGTAYYYKLEREKRDLLFTDNVQSATNEYCQTTSNKQDKLGLPSRAGLSGCQSFSKQRLPKKEH